MAKAIKAALTAAFIVWITMVTFGMGTALVGGTSVLASFTVAGATAIMAGVSTLVSAGIGMLTQKGIDAGAANFGVKSTIRAPAQPRQIVYGETVVGGTLMYISTSGSDNKILHMVIALAGHEIQSVEKVRIDGIETTTSSSTISGETVYAVTNAQFTNANNEDNFGSGVLCRYTVNLGASDQAADGFAQAQISAWGANHRLRGVAYLYIQFMYDQEKWAGIPTVSAIVKGKKVYDPRLNSGSGGTAWSANPALCIRDYLMDTTNGMGALSTEVNDSSTSGGGGFVNAANICDQDVNDIDGSAEDRYTLNGFFNTQAEPAAVLESMLSSCAGKVTYSNGKFNMFAGAAQTPTLELTDDDCLSPLDIGTNQESGNLFNGTRGVFVDSGNEYQAADFPPYQNSTYLNADTPSGGATANYEKWLQVQYPYTLSASTAQRLARIAINSNRQKID